MEVLHGVSNCKSCVYRDLMFGSLTADELILINRNKKEIKFNRGEVISKQNNEIKEFMYLKQGLVKLYRNDVVHKDQIISISIPGDFISLLSIFSNSYYKYSIAALEESIICAVDINMFRQVLQKNQAFGMDLLEKMSTIYDDILDARFNISRRHLRGRIAYILLYFADHVYKNYQYDLPVSRREIAELIEMTTENVIRTLSEFNKDNIIKIDGKNIKIADTERLKKICQLG